MDLESLTVELEEIIGKIEDDTAKALENIGREHRQSLEHLKKLALIQRDQSEELKELTNRIGALESYVQTEAEAEARQSYQN